MPGIAELLAQGAINKAVKGKVVFDRAATSQLMKAGALQIERMLSALGEAEFIVERFCEGQAEESTGWISLNEIRGAIASARAAESV